MFSTTPQALEKSEMPISDLTKHESSPEEDRSMALKKQAGVGERKRRSFQCQEKEGKIIYMFAL